MKKTKTLMTNAIFLLVILFELVMTFIMGKLPRPSCIGCMHNPWFSAAANLFFLTIIIYLVYLAFCLIIILSRNLLKNKNKK